MLVAIALDRYMAIRRAAIGIWNPGLVFCAVCIAGIWLACMAAAVPLFFIYTPIQVYIQSTDELLISELDQATMCVGRRVSCNCLTATNRTSMQLDHKYVSPV